MDPAGPELSDLVIDYDPVTLARRPASKRAAMDTLAAHGNGWARRLLARFPSHDDVLDEPYVNGALVRSHLELQRLHEEFLMGTRMLEVLAPLVRAVRALHPGEPVHVVDVGCGIGFLVRWLAHTRALGDGVRVSGADYNAVLLRAARRLAAKEALTCTFVTGNAFALETPATIYVSTGVLHHFRGEGLTRVFAEQARAGARAFVHFDIKPTKLAPIGSFIFHAARMREPLARHDGYLSAVRAHPEPDLRGAARRGAPAFRTGIYDGHVGALRLVRIMHAIVGVEPAIEPLLHRELGADARRLSAMEGA